MPLPFAGAQTSQEFQWKHTNEQNAMAFGRSASHHRGLNCTNFFIHYQAWTRHQPCGATNKRKSARDTAIIHRKRVSHIDRSQQKEQDEPRPGRADEGAIVAIFVLIRLLREATVDYKRAASADLACTASGAWRGGTATHPLDMATLFNPSPSIAVVNQPTARFGLTPYHPDINKQCLRSMAPNTVINVANSPYGESTE